MAGTTLGTSLPVNLQILKGRPLSEQVYEQLKNAILEGQLEPEVRLMETEVAKQIGVSPTPVREAFRHLAAEGLVEIIPWRGAKVRSISEKELMDTYQCREMLEGLACRLAAHAIDDKGLEKLRQLLDKAQSAATVAEVVELHSSIHNIILDYAGNDKLRETLKALNGIIVRDRALTAYNAKRRNAIQKEHENILAALEQKDADAAEQTMRIHVRNGYAYRRTIGRLGE